MESPTGTGSSARDFEIGREPDFRVVGFSESGNGAGTFPVLPDQTFGTFQAGFPATVPSSLSADSCAVSLSASSVSGKPGMKDILSAEYPEKEVVSPSGMTGSPEETVFKEDIEEEVLMRNSEDVDESMRNEVFGSVTPENASRRTGPTATAEEK